MAFKTTIMTSMMWFVVGETKGDVHRSTSAEGIRLDFSFYLHRATHQSNIRSPFNEWKVFIHREQGTSL